MLECSSKTCEIITETIFPFLGILTAYFIFLSPMKEIQPLRKQKSGVCNINPFPSVMILCNCLSQNIYSFVIHNHWNFWPNAGGFLLGQYYVSVLFASNLKRKDFNLSIIALLFFLSLDLCGGALAFILFKDNYEAAKNSMGIIGIIILCGVYLSPLATFYKVIKDRDSSSISFLMTCALFINGVLWTVYGFFFNDFYIWFPNAVGIASSILQFLLFFIFPKKPKEKENKNILPTCVKDDLESVNSSVTLQTSDIQEKDLSTISTIVV